MQFVVLAKDSPDADAPQRRQQARPAHLAYIRQHRANLHMGVALLDEETGQMNGTLLVAEFPSREALEAWLAQEPYVLANVWQDVHITPCSVGPSFLPPSPVAGVSASF